MAKIAIVALGVSADRYFRVAEMSGNTSFLFDEVWVINGFGHVFACDRVFHMDDVRVQALRAKAGNKKVANLLEWLRVTKIPVVTSRVLAKEPDLERLEECKRIISILPVSRSEPNQPATEYERAKAELDTLEIEKELIDAGGFESLVEFPMQDVLNRFHAHPYFNNTVAYAIAMGALEGHDMTIYGADFWYPGQTLSNGQELVEHGRGCCEYWIGIAVSHGCNVNITGESTLLDSYKGSPLYGYDGRHLTAQINAATGMVDVVFKDIPLPSGQEMEARYYKGPPGMMSADMASRENNFQRQAV